MNTQGSTSPAAVIGGLKTLQRDSGDEVLYPQHLLAEGFVNEGAVGKGEKFAVRVQFTQPDQVGFADQGLAAGVDVHVGPQRLALANDAVDGFQAQIQVMSVLRCPAAGAAEVASGSGVQQNGPGNIAPLLSADGSLAGSSDQRGIDHKIFQECVPDALVQLEYLPDQLVPVSLWVIQHLAQDPPLSEVEIVLIKFVRPIQ